MLFLENRAERILRDLGRYVVSDTAVIHDIQIRKGKLSMPVRPESLDDGWLAYNSDTPWCMSSEDKHALFRAQVTVPEAFDGGKIVLDVQTGRNGWNAINPQMLIYVDGTERQGLDTNHTELLLELNAQKGRDYDIHIYAFSGLTMNSHTISNREESPVYLHMALQCVDTEVETFYYDLLTLLGLIKQKRENSAERAYLAGIVNDAVNTLDFRVPGSPPFTASVRDASRMLWERLYNADAGQDAFVSCVGHSHIDIAWLWRYRHTREKAARSFSTALELMDRYPEFIYMSGQPQLYEYVKEDHPFLFDKIKTRVSEGRWEAEGGMWVEPDVNIPSGESLVRQLLYGKAFFEREFGVSNRVLWLPDVFGFNGNLPQIIKKSGIDYFSTAKLEYNEINKFPYQTFIWRGIDGSEVLCHLVSDRERGYNSLADARDITYKWENYVHKDINDHVLIPFGHGDGGGGPTRGMLESVKRFGNGLPGSPKTRMSGIRNFFESLERRLDNKSRLPKWVGELYLEWHRGTYTTMARNKKFNRKAEFLYAAAEWVSVLDGILTGQAYPRQILDDGWKKILLNQFHDVLPGSSAKEVYDDTDEIYAGVFNAGNNICNNSMERLASMVAVRETSLIVFNPLPWKRGGHVAFKYPADHEQALQLKGTGGEVYPCQKTGADAFLAYVKNVPSMGYAAFEIKDAAKAGAGYPDRLFVEPPCMENRFFKILFDGTGSIKSIWDKRAGREVLQAGGRGNVLQAFEDKPMRDPFWGSDADNWNLDMFYSEKSWEIDGLLDAEVLETGPVRGVLRVKKQFVNSMITQDITIYDDIARVDFKTEIDWKETDVMLKACFPVDINASRASYEIQYGYIERDTHRNTAWDIAKFEVCAHKWADLSDNGYGVSLLNDCKYGYDIQDGVMRLTLLRSCMTPNAEADREVHEFTYSIYPHQGGWREAGTLGLAYDLNQPLTAIKTGGSTGSLPDKLSFASTDRENVIIEAVKMAEDGNGIIIRLYEAYNRRSEVTMTLIKDIIRVRECNLAEKDMGNETIRVTGNSCSFTMAPLEIKTLRIGL